MDINQARIQANAYSRAKAMLTDLAYTFEPFETNARCFYVNKNGGLTEGGETYVVSVDDMMCNCPAHKQNGICKHILACDEILREQAQIAQLEFEMELKANAE